MHSSINAQFNATHSAQQAGSDDALSQARLKLEFLAALFVACWVTGALRMGQVAVADYSAPLLGPLLGM